MCCRVPIKKDTARVTQFLLADVPNQRFDDYESGRCSLYTFLKNVNNSKKKIT